MKQSEEYNERGLFGSKQSEESHLHASDWLGVPKKRPMTRRQQLNELEVYFYFTLDLFVYFFLNPKINLK